LANDTSLDPSIVKAIVFGKSVMARLIVTSTSAWLWVGVGEGVGFGVILTVGAGGDVAVGTEADVETGVGVEVGVGVSVAVGAVVRVGVFGNAWIEDGAGVLSEQDDSPRQMIRLETTRIPIPRRLNLVYFIICHLMWCNRNVLPDIYPYRSQEVVFNVWFHQHVIYPILIERCCREVF
jgi:hypothetical protein